jgi:hypothetical protein
MAEIKVETAASKTPPRKATPKAAPIHSTLTITEQREEAANGFFQMAGLGCIMFGQYSDAGAVSMHGPNISAVAAKMATTNELIAKGLDSFLTVGPYAELIGVTLPFIMQLLANHKVLPADKLSGANVVAPEMLESQVKTQMAQQAMQQMQMQQQAEAELQAMRDEMKASQNGANASE